MIYTIANIIYVYIYISVIYCINHNCLIIIVWFYMSDREILEREILERERLIYNIHDWNGIK